MGSVITSLCVFFLLFSCAKAFNITKILTEYKDFSSFNDLLTKTQLASEINTRNTITVLAIENSIVSSLSGTPPGVLKKVLSVHIILDYYDLVKLQKLSKGTTTLTTLFQSSGQATGKQGFLNVTITSSGGVTLASEAPGSPPGVNVVKSIVSQPYNVSVLQVSHAIVPMGIDGSKSNSSSSSNSTSSPTSSPTPKASPKVAPTTSPSTSPTGSPAPSDDAAGSPSTSPAPAAGAPKADAPAEGAPAADAPAADAPTADGNKSIGVAIGFGTNSVFVIIASSILSLALMI